MMKKTLWNMGVQTLAKLIMAGISFWTTKLLLARLPLADYGVFTLLSSSYLILDSIADFGTRMIGVREISQSKEKGRIITNLVSLRLSLAVVAMVIGVVFVLINPVLLPYRLPAILALLMLVLTSLAGSLEMLCQVRERLDIKSLADILFSLVAALVLLKFNRIDLVGLYLVYLLARVVSLGVGLGWLGLIWPSKIGWSGKVSRVKMLDLFKQSLPMGLYLLLFTSYDRTVDTWMINHWWGKESVAWYGLAYKIYVNLVMPAYFFMNSIYPRLAVAKGEERVGIVKKAFPWLFVMALGTIVLTWVASPFIFEFLLNKRGTDSVNLLRILSLALVFSYFNHLMGFWMVSEERQKTLLKLGMVGLIFNVVVNFITVPLWGYWSAAWVTVGTEAVMCILLFWHLR